MASRGKISPEILEKVGESGGLRIHAEDACAYLRLAFRIWTTELRPHVLGKGQTCAGAAPDEGCVLLAELPVGLANGVVDGAVEIDEQDRPYLVSLRLIQEWLTCGLARMAPSDTVTPELGFGQAAVAGAEQAYARADHTHGTPPDPIPPHVADVTAHAQHTIGGDVTGILEDTTVAAIQHVPVVYPEEKLADGQVLMVVGDERGPSWQPRDLPQPGGDVSGPLDDATVEAIRRVPVVYPEGTPKSGQVLTFVPDEDGGAWQPRQPPEGGGGAQHVERRCNGRCCSHQGIARLQGKHGRCAGAGPDRRPGAHLCGQWSDSKVGSGQSAGRQGRVCGTHGRRRPLQHRRRRQCAWRWRAAGRLIQQPGCRGGWQQRR